MKRTPERERRSESAWMPDERTTGYIVTVVCTLAVLILYRSLLSHFLYNDDFEWMSSARFDMNPGNVLGFRVVNFFRPLINLSFFTHEHLFPGNIRLYYAENITLHAANTTLAYYLLTRLLGDRRVAACAAFLFAITSIHYTAVAWISARTTLFATFFLLASFLAVLRGGRRSVLESAVLYFLALMSKETAVAGFGLVLLLFFHGRREPRAAIDKKAVTIFGVITALYMVGRYVIIGHLTQGNWGPGWNVPRNIAGGFLYQVYPWWLVSLTDVGRSIHESTQPVWPEILAIPVIALFVGAALALRRARPMVVLIAWVLISLVPVSLFKFRFFSTKMVTQDRYYYLSSLGICAIEALLLVAVWDLRRFREAARIAVMTVFLAMIVGEWKEVSRNNDRWAHFTQIYQQMVGRAARLADAASDLPLCVVQDTIPSRPYIADGLRLARPRRRVEQVTSREEAAARRPCLYILLESDQGMISMQAQRME